MRLGTVLVRVGLVALIAVAGCSSPAAAPAAGPASAPTVDRSAPLVHPLPNPTPAGLGLTISEFVTMPPSRPNPPVETGDNLDRWDRINYLGEIPDGSGRLFVPDLNGKLYTIENGVPRTYLDVGATVGPSFWDHSALGTGFGFVAVFPGVPAQRKVLHGAHRGA